MLPAADFVRRSRCQKPPSQGFFSGTGAGRAQQFKDRGAPEQVEIARAGMGRFEKTLR